MSFLSGLAGLFGIDSNEVKARSTILKIKSVMIQSIKDMKNPKLSDKARVLALKNFEESRSVLEDTASNYPNKKIREFALSSAKEILASKDLQVSNLGGYYAGPPLYHLGYSGPPLYNYGYGVGSVYGNGNTPYSNIQMGGSTPDFMR